MNHRLPKRCHNLTVNRWLVLLCSTLAGIPFPHWNDEISVEECCMRCRTLPAALGHGLYRPLLEPRVLLAPHRGNYFSGEPVTPMHVEIVVSLVYARLT